MKPCECVKIFLDVDLILCPQTFKNPKPGLLAQLKESGPVPGDANGIKGADSAKKKRRPDKGVSPSLVDASSRRHGR